MSASDSIPKLPTIPGVNLKPVSGHPGYAVGDDGSVRSCRTTHPGRYRRWRRLSLVRDRYGYLSVKLDGVRHAVHHLVLGAFVGPCPDGMECRHMNGVRDDNRAANLKWGTRKENHADRERHGTDQRGERNPNAKLSEQVVRYFSLLRDLGDTNAQIARSFRVSESAVQAAISRKTWSHVR
jgi:hypothetical protein